MKRAKQQTFEFKSWGGARPGAGPQARRESQVRTASRASRARRRHPVHVTLRLESGLASLRDRRSHSTVRHALARGSARFGLRLVHYSVQTNHLHLVCEAADERALGRGIKGVCVRIARALNRLWQRSGRVFADRYHCHVLKTPCEVHHALAYVLANAAHHKIHFAGPDPCSSGKWFDGWRDGAVDGARISSRRRCPPREPGCSRMAGAGTG
jgi:hypothetical protein